MNLRFINRDGKMILQHRSPCDFKGTNPPFKIEELWADVPTHQESKKVGLVEDLAEHLLEATAYETPDDTTNRILAICKEMLVEKSQIRDLVLDDVPHQYQKRLLEVLDGKQ